MYRDAQIRVIPVRVNLSMFGKPLRGEEKGLMWLE